VQNESPESKDSFNKVFKEYESSFVEIFDKTSKDKPNVDTTNFILKSLEEKNKELLLDEKCNLASSKIFKIAENINDAETIQHLDNLFDYMLKIVETSEAPKTLANVLSTLCWSVSSSKEKRNKILPIILNFMNNKPKLRLPVIFFYTEFL
jgi:hypothetical protein